MEQGNFHYFPAANTNYKVNLVYPYRNTDYWACAPYNSINSCGAQSVTNISGSVIQLRSSIATSCILYTTAGYTS